MVVSPDPIKVELGFLPNSKDMRLLLFFFYALLLGSGWSCYLRKNVPISYECSHYDEFATIEQGDFDADLHLIKRLDPPVDFLRIRHIPVEVSGSDDCFRWANQSYEVLNKIRDRFHKLGENEEQTWTRHADRWMAGVTRTLNSPRKGL